MIFLEKTAQTNKLLYYLLAILCFAFVGYFLIKSFRKETVSFIFLLWSIISIITIYLIGYLYYHRNILHTDILAILFVAVASFLLYYGHRNDQSSSTPLWL